MRAPHWLGIPLCLKLLGQQCLLGGQGLLDPGDAGEFLDVLPELVELGVFVGQLLRRGFCRGSLPGLDRLQFVA